MAIWFTASIDIGAGAMAGIDDDGRLVIQQRDNDGEPNTVILGPATHERFAEISDALRRLETRDI